MATPSGIFQAARLNYRPQARNSGRGWTFGAEGGVLAVARKVVSCLAGFSAWRVADTVQRRAVGPATLSR